MQHIHGVVRCGAREGEIPVLASQEIFRLKGTRAREDTSVKASTDLPVRRKLVSFRELDETRRVNRKTFCRAVKYFIVAFRDIPRFSRLMSIKLLD